MPTRRQILTGLASAAPALVGLPLKADRPIAGGFVLDSQERDHRVNDQALVRQYDKAWRENAH